MCRLSDVERQCGGDLLAEAARRELPQHSGLLERLAERLQPAEEKANAGRFDGVGRIGSHCEW